MSPESDDNVAELHSKEPEGHKSSRQKARQSQSAKEETCPMKTYKRFYHKQ